VWPETSSTTLPWPYMVKDFISINICGMHVNQIKIFMCICACQPVVIQGYIVQPTENIGKSDFILFSFIQIKYFDH
jgi:hypothetical protein